MLAKAIKQNLGENAILTKNNIFGVCYSLSIDTDNSHKIYRFEINSYV